MAEKVTTNLRMFRLNGPLPEYKSTRKFLEVDLNKRYGIPYWKNFKSISSNNVVTHQSPLELF